MWRSRNETFTSVTRFGQEGLKLAGEWASASGRECLLVRISPIVPTPRRSVADGASRFEGLAPEFLTG